MQISALHLWQKLVECLSVIPTYPMQFDNVLFSNHSEELVDQIMKMARALAELQTSLEVYKGLFQDENNRSVMSMKFREIGSTLDKSLRVNLIIGSAALFTDSPKSCGNQNMSFGNLEQKYSSKFSDETKSLKDVIAANVKDMNLKDFRNKYVGHFSLEEMLGKNIVTANVTTDNLEKLLGDGQRYLNLIIKDAQLSPIDQSYSLAFYTPIPTNRSTKRFLESLATLSTVGYG